MSVPNEFEFARNFIGPRLKRLASLDETRANSFQALNDGCREIRKSDGRWGLLEKTGGANVRQRAADIWAYNLGDGTCQLIDVIGDAEGEDGVPRVGWREVDPATEAGIRPIAQWKEPYTDVVVPPQLPDPPQPPSGDLVVRIEALEKEVARLRAETAAAVEVAGNAAMQAVMAGAKVQELANYIGRLHLVPDEKAEPVEVSRGYGPYPHGHKLRARIEG